jgi:hypothetical protein
MNQQRSASFKVSHSPERTFPPLHGALEPVITRLSLAGSAAAREINRNLQDLPLLLLLLALFRGPSPLFMLRRKHLG